jgi:hypothetical protein
VAVKLIVELKAKPGQRNELLSVIKRMSQEMPFSLASGATYYRAFDDPDLLVEIAEWESPELRETVMGEALAAGLLAPLLDRLAAPPRSRLVEPL